MVDENSREHQILEIAADSMFNIGLLMTFAQVFLTYYADASMSFFWDLVNSQVNYCYLPLMTINPPGQVHFYFKTLLFIVTLDPIPIDTLNNVVPIFNFDYVSYSNSKPVFSRIGFADRNILRVIGGPAIVLIAFMLSQFLYKFLKLFDYNPRVRGFLKVLKFKQAYRSLFIIFFAEMYLDLALGGLVNTENHYLYLDSGNWGPKGKLSSSD